MTLEEDLDEMIHRAEYLDAHSMESSALKLSTLVLAAEYCKHFNKDCTSCVAHINDDSGGVCVLTELVRRWL